MDSVVPIENGPSHHHHEHQHQHQHHHEQQHQEGNDNIERSFAEFFQDHEQKAENEIYSDLPPLNERKQALERQLQTRRDPETLQSHGILPPSNKPSHYYIESRQFERARTEDFLNKRLGQRPDKKTLIGYHILPEETNVSPLIIEPQKRLQKAQLAHRLSEKISVRPGPLELIQKGIIEPDNLQLTNNIRNGRVPYEPVDGYDLTNQNYVGFSSAENSPQNSSISSPPGSISSFADIKRNFEISSIQPSRPPSRAESCVSYRNRNQAGQRIKKAKRTRIKFHVYEPSQQKNRKDNCNNANNKNVMQNYENRMKQQQTLLLEMDRLQSHIERVIPQQRNNPLINLNHHHNHHHHQQQQSNGVNEQQIHQMHVKEIKNSPIMIAPSPVPTGDKMMVDIEQRQSRLKPAVSANTTTTTTTMFQPLRPKRVEKLVKKFENCQTPPLVPPPIAFKAPPTPPPVEQLDNNPVLKFEPERVSMYKVRELKAILRDNNLTVSGTKEALIERLMQHHESDKPKLVPGKLKNVKFEQQQIVDPNLESMRVEMEQMRRTIEEKNATIAQLTGQTSNSLHFNVPLELTSSQETITSDVSNQTGLMSASFSPSSSNQSSDPPDHRRSLFSSPSAPTLGTGLVESGSTGQDSTAGLTLYSDHSQSAIISSKYSDRDSGVNSQENLSDVMERDNTPIFAPSLDWLDLEQHDVMMDCDNQAVMIQQQQHQQQQQIDDIESFLFSSQPS